MQESLENIKITRINWKNKDETDHMGRHIISSQSYKIPSCFPDSVGGSIEASLCYATPIGVDRRSSKVRMG